MESESSHRKFHTSNTSSDYSSSNLEPVTRTVSTGVFYIGLLVLAVGVLIISFLFSIELKKQSEAALVADAATVERFLVEQCEEKNVTRRATAAQFEYLILTFINPDDPRAESFLHFVEEANDPVSCDPDSPIFGIDVTPPIQESIPVETPR